MPTNSKKKRPHRPTRAQKIRISGYGLDPAEWLVLDDNESELRLIRKWDETTEVVIKRKEG